MDPLQQSVERSNEWQYQGSEGGSRVALGFLTLVAEPIFLVVRCAGSTSTVLDLVRLGSLRAWPAVQRVVSQ